MRDETSDGRPPARPLRSEIGQSFQLMGLMATVVALWVGLGLLAASVLG